MGERKPKERKEVRIEQQVDSVAWVSLGSAEESTQDAMKALRDGGFKAGHYRIVTVQWEGDLATETQEKTVLTPKT